MDILSSSSLLRTPMARSSNQLLSSVLLFFVVVESSFSILALYFLSSNLSTSLSLLKTCLGVNRNESAYINVQMQYNTIHRSQLIFLGTQHHKAYCIVLYCIVLYCIYT